MPPGGEAAVSVAQGQAEAKGGESGEHTEDTVLKDGSRGDQKHQASSPGGLGASQVPQL